MSKLLLNFTLDPLPLQCCSLTSPTPPTSYYPKTQFPWLTSAYSQNEKKRIYSLNCYSLLHLQMLTRNAFSLTPLEWSPTVMTGLNRQTLPLPFLYCNGCHAWQFSERSLDYVQLFNLLPGNSAHWHLSRARFAPSQMLTAVSWGWLGDSATKGKHTNTLNGLLRKNPNVGELFLRSGLNSLKALQNFRRLMSIVRLDVSLQIDISSC